MKNLDGTRVRRLYSGDEGEVFGEIAETGRYLVRTDAGFIFSAARALLEIIPAVS